MPPPRKPVAAYSLMRITIWGASAGAALFLAVLASRSDVGSARIAFATRGPSVPQVATRDYQGESETQRLSEAVRGLSVDDAQIKSRLAAVEHDVGDITGSITRQNDAAKDARARP